MSDRIVADKLIDFIKSNNFSLLQLNHYMTHVLHLKPDIRFKVISLLVSYDDKPNIDYKKIRELIIQQK